MKPFDVVIAGGAMAGMTLALALDHLSNQQLSIGIVEPFHTDHQAHPGFDSRSIALSHGTVEILKQFALWETLAEVVTPIAHIHVSDRGHAGMTDIDRQELGLAALGYVVELADVGRLYQQKISQCPQITLFCPNAVADVKRTDSHALVSLRDGTQLKTRLLVAADGAVSTCCQQLGLPLQEHDFGQVALIANVLCQQAHQGRAFERFTQHGPLALLPMSEGRMSLVWCMPPEQAERVLALDDTQFLAELQRDFGWRLGKFSKVGSRASYPLLLRYREANISHRFAIVGNAAQTLHPIAGQGFNLGIRDVASLAEELLNSLDDVGRYTALAAFSQRRHDDRNRTIQLTTSLVHIFSNDWLTLRLGRNLGLAAMDNIPALKAPLLRRTLGLVDR